MFFTAFILIILKMIIDNKIISLIKDANGKNYFNNWNKNWNINWNWN
jgi:hypothetical protein